MNEIIRTTLIAAECDVPVPGIFLFFGGIGTGIGKIGTEKKFIMGTGTV